MNTDGRRWMLWKRNDRGKSRSSERTLTPRLASIRLASRVGLPLLPVIGLSLCLLSSVVSTLAAPSGKKPVAKPGAARPEPAADGSAARLYRPAVPPYQFRFPRDHAAHPEFQT